MHHTTSQLNDTEIATEIKRKTTLDLLHFEAQKKTASKR